MHCEDADAEFMATQYGKECWCSKKADLDYGRHGVAECDKVCAGDEFDICGGTDVSLIGPKRNKIVCVPESSLCFKKPCRFVNDRPGLSNLVLWVYF